MTDQMVFHSMREPCIGCGSETGVLTETNGQGVVRCYKCNRFQYNAPKHERGLKPKPMRVDGIKPSERYRAAERAHFQCEFCGKTPDGETVFVTAHMVSERDARLLGLPDACVKDSANIAWLCAECNAGMASKSIDVHTALILLWRHRVADTENNATEG